MNNRRISTSHQKHTNTEENTTQSTTQRATHRVLVKSKTGAQHRRSLGHKLNNIQTYLQTDNKHLHTPITRLHFQIKFYMNIVENKKRNTQATHKQHTSNTPQQHSNTQQHTAMHHSNTPTHQTPNTRHQHTEHQTTTQQRNNKTTHKITQTKTTHGGTDSNIAKITQHHKHSRRGKFLSAQDSRNTTHCIRVS